MNFPTLEQIKNAVAAKGYQYFADSTLNIIGIRSASPVPNTFDDVLCVIYSDADAEHYHYMACTTKPGLFYLDNPDNAAGVAILAPGQYVNLFSKGLHKGQYPCLVQDGDLLVYRDNDRNGQFDYATTPVPAPPSCGIEIHHANNSFASIEVDNWSAGCQVVADPESFAFLMQQVAASGAGTFTYTLIGESDL